MNEFSVRFGTMDSVAGKLENLAGTLKGCSHVVENTRRAMGYRTQVKPEIDRSLSAVYENISSASSKLKTLSSALKDAALTYSRAENKVLGRDDAEEKRPGFIPITLPDAFFFWLYSPSPGGVTRLILSLIGGRKTEESFSLLNWQTKKGFSANYKPGNIYLEGELGLEGSVAKYKKSAKSGLFTAGLEASAFTGKIGAKATCSLFKNGKFEPKIGIGANAEAKGLNAKVSGKFGNEDFDAHANAEGTVGYAKAEAGLDFDIRKGKFGGKAEVGAAVFKGKATGGFKFFGHSVDFSIEGEALSVGANAEFGVDKDSVTIGGKLSALVGLGFRIKISK